MLNGVHGDFSGYRGHRIRHLVANGGLIGRSKIPRGLVRQSRNCVAPSDAALRCLPGYAEQLSAGGSLGRPWKLAAHAAGTVDCL